MNRFRVLLQLLPALTIAALAICLVATPAHAATSGKGLQAGAAVADITPTEWPIFLRGQFNPRPANSSHDPLQACAIALQNGAGRAVIVTVDSVGVSRETFDAAKLRAAEKTGWKPGQMLIAATHTHSAPTSSGGGPAPRVAYAERFSEGVVQAIVDAVGNLEPAQAGWASDEVTDEVFNRRWHLQAGKMPLNPFGEIDKVKMNPPRSLIVSPAGPTDPEVAVLDIRTSKKKPLALLANYALHYVGATPRDQVSADYFGEFRRLMPSRLGRNTPTNFVALMSNGTSGDINNIDFRGKRAPRETFEQIRLVAAKVADAAWRARREIKYESNVPVKMVQREIKLKWRKPTPDLIARAKMILAMTDGEKKKLPRLAENYASRTLSQAAREGTADAIIQAIRIGDQAIVSMPFEVLVEIGLEIKEKSPFKNTIIMELANGSYGYLPPPHQHELGGYETWLGTSRVQKDASEILTRNLLEMLTELR
jgi:hypothetical protein